MKSNNAELDAALAKVDSGVLKRLKFVLKIIKAKAALPNGNNRQSQVYFMEVLDAIGDWSGTENTEMSELLDQQVFPQVCKFISTFSSAEFDSFQQFLIKYTLVKWTEASNYVVLSFISDIYGFIARIAPACVIMEYLELFVKEEMPPYVSFIILPTLLRNLSDTSLQIPTGIREMGLFRLTNGDSVSEELRHQVVRFWNSLDSSILNRSLKSQFVLQQCVCSACHLEALKVSDLSNIVDNLNEVGMSSSSCHSEAFLLVSTILLSSIHNKAVIHPELSASFRNLMDCVVVNAGKCLNIKTSEFVMKVLQRILENATDNQHLIHKMEEVFSASSSSVDGDIAIIS